MNKALLMACAAAITLGAASAVIAPTQDGGDYILTSESGSDTCSAVLAGSGTLCKRGAVKLSCQASSCVGPDGTLVIDSSAAPRELGWQRYAMTAEPFASGERYRDAVDVIVDFVDHAVLTPDLPPRCAAGNCVFLIIPILP